MDTENEPSHDVALAIAIVMGENACDADTAGTLMQDRALALGVTLEEVAATIVGLGGSQRDQHQQNLQDWLHRRAARPRGSDGSPEQAS